MEKSKVIRSLIYKFTERFAAKVIGFVIQILLARLLAPELFGQVVLLQTVIDFFVLVIENGVNTSLIQSPKVSERDYFTVFVITLALTGATFLVMQAAAPLLADFYRSPGLTAPMRFYALSLLFSGFNSIQTARMQREMRFREMMFCNLSATVLAGTLGVVLAWRGAGIWALVGYSFAYIVFVCIFTFLVQRWVPHGGFSKESARRLGGYGLRMMAASAVENLYISLRPLIIGKFFSAAELGHYKQGQQFSHTISINMDAAIRQVMFPVLSRAHDEKEKFIDIMRRMNKLGSFVIFPVMFGLSAVAKPLVLLLLKEQWLPTVPLLAILSIAEAQIPLTSANTVALKSLGRSDLYAKQEVLRRVLMVAVLVISIVGFRSLTAIAIGYAISAWLDVIVTSLPIKRLLGYGALDQFRDVWKNGVSAALMFAAVRAVGLLPLPTALLLLVQVVCGAAVYIALNLILKNDSLLYILSMLRQRRAAKDNP